MNWNRIYSMLLRYLYLYPRSVPRILDIVFWPIVDILLWGFLTVFLSQFRQGVPLVVPIILGALIFWNFVQRSQQAVSIAFLEEVWERNLLNIFVTPLRLSEFLAATVFVGFVRLFLIGFITSITAFLLFQFNIFIFGLFLVPFILNLFLYGWILGLIATSIVMRFGQSAQVLAFALTVLLQPFVAVFYPVSVLPAVLQAVAYIIPVTHVFEGMRSVVLLGQLPMENLLSAFFLNIVWLSLSIALFFNMFNYVKKTGQLMRLID